MSWTRQFLQWTLEAECPFRSGQGCTVPWEANRQLETLTRIGHAIYDGDVCEGIKVRSTFAKDSRGKTFKIARSGARIADLLRQYGASLDEARKICGGCPANASDPSVSNLAGCQGKLNGFDFDNENLEKVLQKTLKQTGMKKRFSQLFHLTTPLWYGLWIDSPLKPEQSRLLAELFRAAKLDVPVEGLEITHWDFEMPHFLNALDIAATGSMRLHVYVPSVWSCDEYEAWEWEHCPRCKKTLLSDINERSPTQRCKVCRFRFDLPDRMEQLLNSTHYFDIDDGDGAAESNEGNDVVSSESQFHSIQELFGPDREQSFQLRYLIQQGCAPEECDVVLGNEGDSPLLRRIRSVRRGRAVTLADARRKKAPTVAVKFAEKRLRIAINSEVEIDFLLIPAGTFQMGWAGDGTSTPGGHAPGAITISIARPFYLGKVPVTLEQWQALMDSNPNEFDGDGSLPVDRASWLDAQEFCERLTARSGLPCRLPTEAEWEYACRAGTTTRFSTGDELLSSQGNFKPREEFEQADAPKRQTTAVVTYPPNQWGLFDMHGNIFEWCEDCLHEGSEGMPVDGSPYLLNADSQPRQIMRGGSFNKPAAYAASYWRESASADTGPREPCDSALLKFVLDMYWTAHGFRVVCEVI
ncbi:Serine/threonine-protein kinase pkn1 [Caulifigura coniformis]|uniref:Serine/threonine-protein kinase pkn1 n=1 Tax=Caulifigura coniformis TaxID=2527983 RepID=A0A517SMK8_9PLAN|nr:formylglycine-generating enzyme family protein [Caulifigura coniformis]QDT57361.1 Serine/threonine-protein kinase pkn1 [Caulifigura coniformis]